MLAVPSLNPKRFRGVAWLGRGRRGAAVAELRPAHRRGAEPDAGEVADRVHGDLRVVGAGLHAQVAVAARGVEVVGREVRQRLSAAGRRSASPNRSLPSAFSKRVGPEAEGDREPGRRGARSPRRCRRRAVVGARAPVGRRPAGPPSSALRPRSTAGAAAPGRRGTAVVTSNAAKCSRSWAGVTMPAWCATVERVRRGHPRRAARPPGRRAKPPIPAPTPRAPTPAAPSRRRRESGPRRTRRPVLRGRHSVSAPVIFDSGSESASTALESSLALLLGHGGRRTRSPPHPARYWSRSVWSSSNRLAISSDSSGSLVSSSGCETFVARPAHRRRWPGSRRGRCATRCPPRP